MATLRDVAVALLAAFGEGVLLGAMLGVIYVAMGRVLYAIWRRRMP